MTTAPPERDYTPLFVPDAASTEPFDDARAFRLGDRQDSGVPVRYVFDEPLALAVNVALAAGRPLLLRGHPGTGKTSMARSVAAQLGWRFYPATVSSRTSARDLQWTFDTVARLADAETEGESLRPRAAYMTPGPLWWAFDPSLAKRRGLSTAELAAAGDQVGRLKDPSDLKGPRAVVLIDEIDKADPDVPNDLLLPLGSLQFQVDEGPMVKARRPPLVVVTTNEERDLPRAFLRRCVVHTLEQPSKQRLRDIAVAHAGASFDAALFDSVLERYLDVRTRRIAAKEPPPSVAELLDVLAACRSLKTTTAAQIACSGLERVLLDKATSIPVELPVGPDPE